MVLPPRVSGWRLFRYRLLLFALFSLYSLWFWADTLFTIYVQVYKMGHEGLQWAPLNRAADWIHADRATILELWLVILPKLLAFGWLYVCVSLFLFVVAHIKDEPDLWLPDLMDEEDYPTVDIFLPRTQEPWSVLKPTVMAALRLHYPLLKFSVHVLDDWRELALREALQAECQMGRNNLNYRSRKEVEDGKGGNLNFALKETDADLIAVLDADMVVAPEFLLRLIPHLLEWSSERQRYVMGRTAFVQGRQSFYSDNSATVRYLEGMSSLFYGLVMPGLNGMGAAPSVGTGFVMQRAALEDVGGFQTGFRVEDVTTALEIHRKGWTSKYKKSCLAVGLAPATLQAFFKERLQRVTGSAQLLLRQKPLFGPALSPRQRLGTYVAHSYWLVTVIALALMFLRYFLWVLWLYVTPASHPISEPRRALLLEGQYLPALLVLLGLPDVGIRAKLHSLMAVVAFVPIHAGILWQSITGGLKGGAAVSRGLRWGLPKDVWLNVAMVVSATTLFLALLVLPRVHDRMPTSAGPVYYVQMGVMLGCVWVANWPVLYEACRSLLLGEKGSPQPGVKTGSGPLPTWATAFPRLATRHGPRSGLLAVTPFANSSGSLGGSGPISLSASVNVFDDEQSYTPRRQPRDDTPSPLGTHTQSPSPDPLDLSALAASELRSSGGDLSGPSLAALLRRLPSSLSARSSLSRSSKTRASDPLVPSEPPASSSPDTPSPDHLPPPPASTPPVPSRPASTSLSGLISMIPRWIPEPISPGASPPPTLKTPATHAVVTPPPLLPTFKTPATHAAVTPPPPLPTPTSAPRPPRPAARSRSRSTSQVPQRELARDAQERRGFSGPRGVRFSLEDV